MAVRKSTFINMVTALFLVTFISAGALGFVYHITKEAIDHSKMKAQSEAIEKILPEFDQLGEPYKVAAESTGGDTLEFFPAYKNNELVGIAIKTYTNRGFNGFISIMVGIDNAGKFSGYEILEHTETPGLGSKMSDWFSNTDKPEQCIIGKNPEKYKFEVVKDGGDINAITAATITSRAFLDALTRAYNAYKEKENTNAGTAGQ